LYFILFFKQFRVYSRLLGRIEAKTGCTFARKSKVVRQARHGRVFVKGFLFGDEKMGRKE
jgi:hypothetical protein